MLFDGLVLPDGQAGIDKLASGGQTLEFIQNIYRHCKTIMALGASTSLLDAAGIATTLPSGDADPGLLVGDASDAPAFVAALGQHRHYSRDTDPPLV